MSALKKGFITWAIFMAFCAFGVWCFSEGFSGLNSFRIFALVAVYGTCWAAAMAIWNYKP